MSTQLELIALIKSGNSTFQENVGVTNPEFDGFGNIMSSVIYPTFTSYFKHDQINGVIWNTNTIGASTISVTDNILDLTINNNGDLAEILSNKNIRCYSGVTSFFSFCCLFDNTVADYEQEIGLFDNDDGTFLYNNSPGVAVSDEGMNIVVRNNGVDTIINNSNWDDPLDGNGLSGLNIDFTKFNVFRCEYSWLGIGGITWYIYNSSTNNYYPFHKINGSNLFTTTQIKNPTLPLKITTSAFDNTTTSIKCLGFFSGLYNYKPEITGPKFGITEDKVIGSSFDPILTIRNKSVVNSITNKSSVYLKKYNISTDGASMATIHFILDANLSGDSFTDISSNSIVEYDISANNYSSGENIYELSVSRYTTLDEYVNLDDICLHPGQSLTIVAKYNTILISDLIGVSLFWVENV